MILPIYPQNDHGISPNIAKFISNYMCQTLYITLPLILFKSDPPSFSISKSFNKLNPPLFNHAKTHKELVGEIL